MFPTLNPGNVLVKYGDSFTTMNSQQVKRDCKKVRNFSELVSQLEECKDNEIIITTLENNSFTTINKILIRH